MSQRETQGFADQLTLFPDETIDAAVREGKNSETSRQRLLRASRSVEPHARLRRSVMRVHALLAADQDGLILSAYRSDLGGALSAFLKHAEAALAGRLGPTDGTERPSSRTRSGRRRQRVPDEPEKIARERAAEAARQRWLQMQNDSGS